MLNKQRRAPLTVVEVREHRAREELLPHRLPEPLDLAAGLRVMRAALDVPDAVAAKLLLKPRLAPPRGVLTTLIGKDLARRAVVRNRACKRLQHKRAPLVMRHHQAHQVARVIIQERRHVHALVPSQEEREEVRLPELVGLGALKAPLLRLGLGLRHRTCLRQALLLQHPAHRRIGSPDAEEAPHCIANPAAPRLRLGLLRRNHRLAARIAFPLGFAVTHRARASGRKGRPRAPCG